MNIFWSPGRATKAVAGVVWYGMSPRTQQLRKSVMLLHLFCIKAPSTARDRSEVEQTENGRLC